MRVKADNRVPAANLLPLDSRSFATSRRKMALIDRSLWSRLSQLLQVFDVCI